MQFTANFPGWPGNQPPEDPVDQRAKEIIAREHQRQNEGLPEGMTNPLVILDGCSQEEKAILELYLQGQKENAKYAASQRTLELSGALCVNRPFAFSSPLPSFDQILHPKKKAAADIGVYDLMQEVLRQVRLVNYEGAFYCLNGSIFKYIAETDLRTLVFQILEPVIAEGRNPKIVGSVIDALRDYPRIKAKGTTESPDRVFFLNGAYNLAAHVLSPIEPTDFFTTYIPVNYESRTLQCPCFDHYLSMVSGGDEAIETLIWEVLGYLLVPDMAGKAFFVLQGVGDTGKSVFGNLVSSFFNPEALSFLDIYRFKDRFSTSVLRGKRLNTCMDLPRGQISREAIGTIKMITGDDVITIEEKFRGAEPYKPTCKLLFGSNFPLMPADNDAAFRARLVIIPFLYPVPKEQQDKHLLEKLMQERNAIAQKALDCYLRLKARNYQFTAVNVPCLMNGYIAEHELMESFLKTYCVFLPDCYTPTADLLKAYNAFRVSKNISPMQDAAFFSRQLNQFCLGRIQSKKKRQGLRSLNGYLGIGLKEVAREI